MIIISPAKTLDWESSLPSSLKWTEPRFKKHTKNLQENLAKLSSNEIASLMSLSKKLAELNYSRYQKWETLNTRPAIYAFKGDVYTGLDINKLSINNVIKAQSKLRILSGLYGLIRPLDKIKPYRLEMGTKLSFQTYKNLYEFWNNHITELLQEDIKKNNSKILINLASNEYSKILNFKNISIPVITPIFQDWKKDTYKIISFYAKKARGAMAKFIIEQDIPPDIKKLEEFNWQGYKFVNINSEGNIVFRRKN